MQIAPPRVPTMVMSGDMADTSMTDVEVVAIAMDAVAKEEATAMDADATTERAAPATREKNLFMRTPHKVEMVDRMKTTAQQANKL